MRYPEAITQIKRFLISDEITKQFGNTLTTEPWPNCSPTISTVNPELPKNGFGHKSGIYFLCSTELEIYYIVDASPKIFNEEVWSKVSSRLPVSDEKRTYPKNYFINKPLNNEAVNNVTNGELKIGVLTMD